MIMRLLVFIVHVLVPVVVSLADVEWHNTTLTKLAFGSCHKRKYALDGPDNIWRSVALENPQAFLWTGDAVYPPTREVASIEMLEHEYNELRHDKNYHDLLSLLPLGVYGTWDDHDYGGNDMGKGMTQKQARKEALFSFLGYPKDLLRNGREGVHHSVEFGTPPRRVKLLFLDTRWNRDNAPSSSCLLGSWNLATSMPLGAGLACLARWMAAGFALQCPQETTTILGEAQWSWLEHELSTSQAQLHVVVSSIQVLTTSPVVESWGHFPNEQTRLLQLLQSSSRVPTILLSGDVHYAEMMYSSSSLSVMEVTSSGLTHTCEKPRLYGFFCRPLLRTFSQHRTQPNDGYYVGRNFGTLELDWKERLVRVRVHTNDQEVVLDSTWQSLDDPRQPLEHVAPVLDGHLIPKLKTVAIFAIVLFSVAVQLYLWFVMVPEIMAANNRTSTIDDDDDDERELLPPPPSFPKIVTRKPKAE